MYVCKYVCIKYRIISVIKLLQRYSHTLTMKTFNQQPFSRYSIFCDVNYINVCMYVRMYVSVYLYDIVMQCVVSNSVHVRICNMYVCTYAYIVIVAITGIKSLYVNLPVGQGHAQLPLCG